MAEVTTRLIGDFVEVKGEFLPFVDLRLIDDVSYRRQCRESYVYTDEDIKYFQLLYRSIAGLLPQKKRNLILLGPFGVGKSLNLMLTYDLFTSKRNAAVLKNFKDPSIKAQLTSLTQESPFLVVVLMGTKVEGSLQDALIEALIQAMPEGVSLASDFSEAVQYLNWLSLPEQRDLRERFELGLRTTNPALSTESLRKGISFRREDLELFREAYQSAFGTPHSRLGSVSASKVYAEAMKEVIGTGKPYSGLLVLFDEFGQWIDGGKALEQDYLTLTEFGEWIHSCDNASMVVATQAIPRNFKTSDDYDRFQTFRGRCEVFRLQRENYEDLIGGALRERGRNKDEIKTNSSWAKLAELQRAYHPTYGDDAQKAVWGYYPFHPSVIAGLRPLSDKLGQYERTIFKFVDPSEEGGLQTFLEEPALRADGRLNILTLDYLFRYFRDEIAQELADTYMRYEEASLENKDDPLATKVLQLLVVLHVLGPDAPCAATPENLADLLSEPDCYLITQALTRLEEQGHVFTEHGAHRLAEAGAMSRRQVEARLTQVVVRDTADVTAQDVLTELRNYSREAAEIGEGNRGPDLPISEGIESQRFLQQYAVRRKLLFKPIVWRDIVDLADKASKERTNVDPLDIYVVVVTDDENEQGIALNEARKAAAKLASEGACVGVPTAPFTDGAIVRGARGVRELESERPFRGTRALELEKSRRLHELLDALDRFASPSNYEWYSPLGSPMPAPLSASGLVDTLALHYGAKFPPGIKSPEAVGGVRIESEVVERLSKPTFGMRMPKRKAEQVIEQALVPLGLVEVSKAKPTHTEASALVRRPDRSLHKESLEIFGMLEQGLPQGSNGADQIAAVIRQVSNPPYWLPKDLVAYYIAAFLTTSEATILKNGSRQSLTHETLRGLIDSQGKGFVIEVPKRVTMNDDERGYLHAVAQRIARSVTNPQYANSLRQARRDGVLRRRELEQIRSDMESWWTQRGISAKARRDENFATLGDFTSQLLEVLDEGFKNGTLEDPEFYTKTLPSRLAANTKIGEFGTRVVAAIEEIDQVARAPRPSPTPKPEDSPPVQPPVQPVEDAPAGDKNISTEVAEPVVSEAVILELIGLLEEIRMDAVSGHSIPSVKELFSQMQAVVERAEGPKP